MDEHTTDTEVLSSERSDQADRHVILEFGPFTVLELALPPERLLWLWESMSKYKSLFSDLTKGDFDNFLALISDKNSYWMMVEQAGKPVGVIYLAELQRVTDCEAHINFFDGIEKLDEKYELCRALIPILLKMFHLQRISASIPRMYWRTIKFVKRLGFQTEGLRRDIYRIGGKWVNEMLLGVTRGDLDGRID